MGLMRGLFIKCDPKGGPNLRSKMIMMATECRGEFGERIKDELKFEQLRVETLQAKNGFPILLENGPISLCSIVNFLEKFW